MSNYDVFVLSFKNILRNKLKFILTVISVTVGITSVIIITTISDIGKDVIETELNSLGIDGIALSNKNDGDVLTEELVQNIQNNFDDIDYVMPMVSSFGAYSNGARDGSALVLGVDENLFQTLKITKIHGREFAKSDILYQKNYCIVDEDFANELYKRSNILGKEITLSVDGFTRKFEVIGIISNQKALIDSFVGENSPRLIYIPKTVAMDITGESNFSQIAIRASADLENIKSDLEYYFSKNSHLQEEISVQNISSYMDSAKNITNYIGIILSAVASVALVVATIGVSNMMFSSATERKKEIGIYMALGATRTEIRKIFLLESILICLFSGAIGVIIGVISIFLLTLMAGVNFYINPFYIVIVFITSLACGVLSGIFPANKASKLNPIEVLRE